MILFFDTETSGMYQWKLDNNHVDQPHLMQIAAILADDSGKIITQFSSLVKPMMKYRVDPEAENVHGLTWDMCNKQGIESERVMELFVDMCKKSDLIVAHNMNFDYLIIKSFLSRLFVADIIDEMKKFCTMAATTNILKLPGKFEGKYKWTKLDECYRFFFAEELTNAHDAMSDVMACKRVFFHLANHYDICI